jgi:hypothetical protein
MPSESALQYFRNLLGTLKQLPKMVHCPDCGLVMKQREGTLFLDATDESWDVALPFCTRCDPVGETKATSLPTLDS